LDSDRPSKHVTIDAIAIRHLRLLETPVVDSLTFVQFQHWDAFSNGVTFSDAGLPARRLEGSFSAARAVDFVTGDIISKPDPTNRNFSLQK
jgi:hypothetical protein